MFEEERDDKIYNLIITQGIDNENEYKEFTAKLYSKPEFLWTETYARDYSAFSSNFYEKVDLIVLLSGLYNENKKLFNDLLKVSNDYDLPILLVRPYGMEEVPEKIEEKSKAVIGWNANCIVDSIRDIVNGNYDDDDFDDF